MKAFVFGYSTNYDLGAAIIYANSEEEAIELASRSPYIWGVDNYYEIDTENNKSKIIIIRENSFDESDERIKIR